MKRNDVKIKFLIKWALNIMLLLLISCKSSGGKFGALDAVISPDVVVNPVNIVISSFTPSTTPLIIVSNSNTTFGITLAETDSSVNYTFLLDDTNALQSGTNPFYGIDASTLTPGSHTLKVTATNSISTASHTFSFKVNQPTGLIGFSPTLTGTSIACGVGSVNMSAAYQDLDTSDSVTATWYINETEVLFGSTIGTTATDSSHSTTSLNYHPNCVTAGINFVRLDLFDGYETTSTNWTVYVTAPITISIADAIPTDATVVLTASSSATFAVSLLYPDGAAKYDFYLDTSVPLQVNDARPYYNLFGSSMTAGTHTLKVHAYNSTSSADKIFNIRKNSPPTITAFSPAFSGTNINCGSAPMTLYADMADTNGDTLNYTWTMDDAPSSYLTTSNSGNRAQVAFNPSCAISGTRVIKAIVSDGYETTTLTWSIVVATPISVVISSYLPLTYPTVIITNSQTVTFAVALAASDSSVAYTFTLQNLTTLATTTLQTGTVPFYNLAGSSIAAGNYKLTATASNGSSSAFHDFSVRKNSPPSVPPTALTYSPTLTGTTLGCGAANQLFQSNIGDTDGDAMTVTWSLDGNTSPANFVTNNTTGLARATYTPSCAEVGIKTIKLDVYDGFETTTLTWTAQVVNPTLVSINSYSPSTDPIDVLSTGVQSFTVSATGKSGLVYEWKLDGSVIGSATNAYYTLSGSSLSTGPHTLIVKVSDSDSNQSHTFNLIKNSPPSLTNKTPNAAISKININTIMNFSSNFTDANSDTMTVTWKLNNVTITNPSTKGSITTGSSLTTFTISPSASLLGDNTVDLIVSDGKESTTTSWNININYFSDICNNMGASKICTILGQPGMGSNVNPATSGDKVKIKPDFIEPYGDASGSYFFSDLYSNSIFFYNKSATDQVILGQTITANTLKMIAGTGVAGSGTNGTQYNDFPFNNPKGLAWDNVNKRLFISDDPNSRVVMLDSSGTVTVILGGGGNNTAGNQNAQISTASYCANPYGLAYSSAQNKLYVACTGSHTIKYVDTSSATVSAWTATVLVGATTAGVSGAGTVSGTNGILGTAKINAPNHLKFDSQNSVLYFTTSGDCRVRAADTINSARGNYFFSAINFPANNTVIVAGAGCGTYTMGGYASVIFNGGVRMGLELDMSGSALNGIYVSDYNTHRVAYLNNLNATVKSVGGTTVSANSGATIWGSGTAGYYTPCTSSSWSFCYLSNPSGMAKIGNYLYLADFSNNRVRSLDVSVANGTVADALGYDAKAGFGGNGGVSSESVQFNTPLNLYYDSASNKLIISDFYNYKIRSVSLTTGAVNSFISNGFGNANSSQVDPTVLGMQGPRAVVNYGGFFLFADTLGSNCVIRALNTAVSVQTILGISTNTNAVQTVAGSYNNGCGLWSGSATTGTHVNVKLNQPSGIATDGTNLYIANTSDHCILKVDFNGNFVTPSTNGTFAGLCGTPGTVNAAGTAYSAASIRFYYPSAIIIDPRPTTNSIGNLFVMDQTSTGQSVNSRIRYINQSTTESVTIYGVSVGPGEIKTVIQANDNYGNGLAAFDNQICYSSGGGIINNASYQGNSNTSVNNVNCVNRDDSFGTNLSARIGRNPLVYIGRGAIQHNQEEEGVLGTSASLAGPAGLAFDGEGNLYIAERSSHVIRKVTKWW